MNTFFYIFLFIFGSMFGSFGSVLIYRLKSSEGGILNGRSHCTSCEKILNAFDLIPVFSWLKNKGKCAHCEAKVSAIYPTLEIVTGSLFLLIGYFLIDFNLILLGNILEISKLIFWLFIGFISVIYTFYDILFFEINDKIMLSGIVVSMIVIGIQTLFPSIQIINSLPIGINNIQMGIYSIILSIVVISSLYIIIFKELKEIWDILILSFLIIIILLFKKYFGINLSDYAILNGAIGALGIFIFFFLQIIISKGAWLGGGDLRIAIFIGLILGVSFSFSSIMITYLVGSIIGISLIIGTKIRKGFKTKFNSMIPFGPFLAIGFFINILLLNEVSKLIEKYFGLM